MTDTILLSKSELAELIKLSTRDNVLSLTMTTDGAYMLVTKDSRWALEWLHEQRTDKGK